MIPKKIFLSILFLLNSPLPIIAMLSKSQSTAEERKYTQTLWENQKKQTDLLINECKKKNPDAKKALSFIELGADINAQGSLGETPLLYACVKNNFAFVKMLVENGAEVNLKAYDGNTPLHIVCEEGYVNIAEFLIVNGADINNINNNRDTPLHRACEFGHFNVIVVLIKKGAHVNVKNKIGVIPLHLACDNNENNDHNFFKIAQYLVNNGADVNAKTASHHTSPLHFACRSNNINIVQLLLNNNADINATTNIGCTPLMLAVIDNYINICKLLLDAHANPNLETNDGLTALNFAYDLGDTKSILLFKKYGISTRSEQQADENMHALFTELNEEKLQKQQKLIIQQQKKQEKKAKTEKAKKLSEQIEASKQYASTIKNASAEEPLTPETVVISPTTATTSPTSTMPTSIPSPIKTTTITTPSIQSKNTIQEEKIHGEYQILIGEKLKWPQSLSQNQQESIKDHLRKLKNWPNHGLDVKKLKGKSDLYRLRVGGYRIIFSVNEARHEIKIYEIGLRKSIYKNLKL